MEGQDLRQTLVTIGMSIVFADLMLWAFGGDFYQIQTPSWLVGPIPLPFVTAVKSSGEAVYSAIPDGASGHLRRLRRHRRRRCGSSSIARASA